MSTHHDTSAVAARALAQKQRWAALATQGIDGPYASMVAYEIVPDRAAFVMLLSGLAEHTRNLQNNAVASLAISEPDTGLDDPQHLARLTVQGVVQATTRANGAAWDQYEHIYLARFPRSEQWLTLGDFQFYTLVPQRLRFIGGFGEIFDLHTSVWQSLFLQDGSHGT